MPSRILNISQEQLDNSQRVDLIGLECTMLYPDNEAMRSEAEFSASVEAVREISATLDETSMRLLAEAAPDALPLRSIHADTSRRQGGPFVLGLMAGDILFYALERNHHNTPDASMKCVLKDVASRYAPIWQVTAKSLENRVWNKYRSVAHFWAAFVYLSITSRPGSGDKPRAVFPCAANQLPKFLAFAEAFRLLGEATRLRQAPTTILRVHESVLLPEGLLLPEVDLDLSITKAA